MLPLFIFQNISNIIELMTSHQPKPREYHRTKLDQYHRTNGSSYFSEIITAAKGRHCIYFLFSPKTQQCYRTQGFIRCKRCHTSSNSLLSSAYLLTFRCYKVKMVRRRCKRWYNSISVPICSVILRYNVSLWGIVLRYSLCVVTPHLLIPHLSL